MAFLIIAVIVGLMFRSIKLAFLTLLPNILPLLMVTFVMWIGGIDLKISTSLIFTLAFGIAVDDTIHLLAKYKLEMKKGRSHVMALKRSYLSSGKAIIVTSLILIGGFLTLMFSSFASTFYMGLLVSVTLVLAVVLDLLIMPMIILYAGKK
jgi:predicted RND superfamily exporter protein